MEKLHDNSRDLYIFVINKAAGKGKGQNILKQLQKDETYHLIQCRTFITRYKGHAEVIVKNAIKMFENKIKCFIVIGGDGTIHEVINGLKGHKIAVSFIPAGSGNDFARGHQIYGKPLDILKRTVCSDVTSKFWPGTFQTNNQSNKQLFVNSIGFGLDGLVVKQANQSSYKRWLNRWGLGSISYVIALLKVLKSFKPKTYILQMDGVEYHMDNVWMVTISNHPYYGGGMKISPTAKIESSRFPVLVVQNISVWKIMLFFLTVFIGKHINLKEVSIFYASHVRLKSSQMVDYQVDGEHGNCKTCSISKQIEANRLFGSSFKK